MKVKSECGEVSLRSMRLKRIIGFNVALLLLVTTVLLSLMIGTKSIPFNIVYEALFSDSDSYVHTIIKQGRVPRTLIALVVGPAFGLAGALIQAITHNRLADPGILGINAGASFAVAIGIGFFSMTSISSYIWFALVGALLSTIAVFLISGGADKKIPTPTQITLTGVAIGAVLNGVTTSLTLMNSSSFSRMLNWNVGTLVRRDFGDVMPIVPILVAGLILAIFISPSLNIIAFGEDSAASLGVSVGFVRIVGLMAVSLLAGGATAIAGPISFIGLMVPHCVKWYVGSSQPWIFLYSIVVAPILLLISDIVGRVILAPEEIPVGIIMGFIGAPILIILMRGKNAKNI